MAPVRADYEERHPERRTQDRHADKSRNGSNERKGRTPVERAALRHEKVVGTPWWGIDGEGVDRQVGRKKFQDYVYMSASLSGGPGVTPKLRELDHNGERLRTHDCLWFLWNLPRARNAFYSSGYDWDKILSDLPRSKMEELYDSTRDPFDPVWWEDWGIINLRNAVTIVRQGPGRLHHKFFADMWRCLGAGSFIDACKAWSIGSPEDIEEMEYWKPRRGAFTEAEYAERGDEIRHYCQRETANIAAMAYKASVAASEIDLRPPQWYSAGSIGKALFRKHGVPAHRGPDRWADAPQELHDAISTAFNGGRFEAAATGPIDDLYEYDLASAYPANMVQEPLPCLAHGSWKPGRYSQWTLEQVSWAPEGEMWGPWGPLPFRAPDGSIAYPTSGRTWAWSIEVDAARTIPGYQWVTHEEWSWVPTCDHRPFDWVPEVYEQRLALGKDGAGLILKVGSNAGYGTTADTTTPNSKYASAVWAGLITAGTRAKLCEVISAHPDKVILTATDSVVCTEPIMGFGKDKRLGGWDFKGKHSGVLLIQPGLYYAEEGLERAKSRGHNFRDFCAQIPALRAEWEAKKFKGAVSYDRTRFVTSKLALHRKDWSTRGQWISAPVKINFMPSSRMPGYDTESLPGGAIRTWPLPNLSMAQISAPYKKLVATETYHDLLTEKIMAEDQP